MIESVCVFSKVFAMLLYYSIPAGLVLIITLSAYWRDQTIPKTRPFDWFFIAVTTLLWPLTAPFIVWKKLVTLRNRHPHGKFISRPSTRPMGRSSQDETALPHSVPTPSAPAVEFNVLGSRSAN